jgi:hypothetical protein
MHETQIGGTQFHKDHHDPRVNERGLRVLAVPSLAGS